MIMIKKTILGMMLIAMGTTAMAQGLKDAYKDYFMIGVAVNQRNVTNAEQAALVKKEFNSMAADSIMKLSSSPTFFTKSFITNSAIGLRQMFP